MGLGISETIKFTSAYKKLREQLRLAMDQETANVLFDKGAILLFLDPPENLEFGIDFNAWSTGPLFKGVKLIPPGLHFVFYRYVGAIVVINLETIDCHTWLTIDMIAQPAKRVSLVCERDSFDFSKLERYCQMNLITCHNWRFTVYSNCESAILFKYERF